MRTRSLPSSSAVAEARAVQAAAVADQDARLKRNEEISHGLARANARLASGRADFMTVRFPAECEQLEQAVALARGEYAIRLAAFELACALDADAVAEGDTAASCLASLIEDLRALAAQLQLGGDTVGTLRAVDARVALYETAFQALAAKRRAAGDPEPLRIHPYRAWQALLAKARAEKAGLSITAQDVYAAAHGHLLEPPPAAMCVEEAIAHFCEPQTPPEPSARIAALKRQLEELNRAAYDEHERLQKANAEKAQAAKDAARRRAERDAEMRAAELAASVEWKMRQDAVRERQAKIAEFAEAAARARASAGGARSS
jgi:hypothetical protein